MIWRDRRLSLLLVCLSAASITLHTQTGPAASFEVASIKRSAVGERDIFIRTDGETFTARNATARELLSQTQSGKYLPSEIVGGPEWTDVDRFVIVAKTGRPQAPALRMLHSLLVDRFKLHTHTEDRLRPVYRLVLARKDKKLGPGLTQTRIDCKAAAQQTSTGMPRCGFRPGPGSIVGTGISLSLLANVLSSAPDIERRVLDNTGLRGDFDIALTWTTDAPSVFTAVQEQLGLKLEADRELVPVLVIDAIQRPEYD